METTNNTQTVAELIHAIEMNTLSTIYSKDDVLRMLNTIKQTDVDVDALITTLNNAIGQAIDDLSTEDLVDFSSAEFTLNYNEVQLEDVRLNSTEIYHAVKDSVKTELLEFFTNKELEQNEQ